MGGTFAIEIDKSRKKNLSFNFQVGDKHCRADRKDMGILGQICI